jgi:hypothetical protein
MLLGIKPAVDFVFKKVFGSPENVSVLIGLLNAILKLAHPIVHVEILNPFSYQEFADDKLIVLDIRARDSAGRWLNIEMQVTIFPGLLQRLVYHASAMYVDQLKSGGSYADLRSAISICLLDKILFGDDTIAHHRFRLMDPEHGMEIPDSIEVHTVELTKYNLPEATMRTTRRPGRGCSDREDPDTPGASRRRVEFHRKSARTNDGRAVHHAGGSATASAFARIVTEWRSSGMILIQIPGYRLASPRDRQTDLDVAGVGARRRPKPTFMGRCATKSRRAKPRPLPVKATGTAAAGTGRASAAGRTAAPMAVRTR